MVRHILAWVAALTAATQVLAAPAPDAAVKPASVPPSPPPVEDYGKLPAMQFVRLSPSGARYAYIAKIGDQRHLVVATTDNQLIENDDIGRAKIRGVSWADDDHVLVYTSATVELGIGFRLSKAELGSVVVVNLKARRMFAVFGGVQERVAKTVVGTYGTATIKGRLYGYFGGYGYQPGANGHYLKKDSDGSLYPDLYQVDLDTGEFTLVSDGQYRSRGWLVRPTGEIAARLLYDQSRGDWSIRASNWGGLQLASGRAPIGRVALLGFGATPDEILVRTPQADHDLIQVLPLKGGPATASFNADTFGSPIFDPVTHLWIGERQGDDHATTIIHAPVPQARLAAALKAFPGYFAYLVSHGADFSRMIVFTDGGDDSGTYWFVDIAQHSAVPLGGDYPNVTAVFVGPVRWFEYKAADGLILRGVLTLPPGRTAKNLPVVVMPHGGPEAHDILRFDYWGQVFAARGYAVFQPNFRGSNGSGNTFRDAGFGQWGRKMQTDISDGVAELAHQGIIDPKRACIVGWSYGGYAALAGVTLQQGLYRCAASYGGVSDLPDMLNYARDQSGDISAATRYWKAFMGVTTAWESELKPISPARIADHADAPILLIHGKEDTVVPIEQSLKMDRALRNAGKPVELITLPGADHWLLEEDARVAMVKASVEFVMKNNPPDPPPTIAAPAAAQ